MKKSLWIPVLLCLFAVLLCACAEKKNNSATVTAAPPDLLPGVWVNEGRYTEGRDFVETLTVNPDGTLTVHLDYQGSPYADLTGTWAREGKSLTFTMSDGTVRVYDYEADAAALTLTGSGKEVRYQRMQNH